MISNRVIIIVSAEDQAGMNMLDFLLDKYNFSKEKPAISDQWPNGKYIHYNTENISILQIPQSQIFTDYFVEGLEADLLVFASKHSSSAGQKALLVHTTGIWQKEAGHGGNDHELAYAPANLLAYAYERIKKLQEARDLEYWTGIECTHHGPSSLDVPIAYFEAGGTEEEWNDREACKLISDVIVDTIETFLKDNLPEYPAFIGLGGNHYCSRFISILDDHDFGIGHILPKYASKKLPENMLEQAYNKTLASEKIFLIDKKGLRAHDRDRFIAFIEEKGYAWEFA